MAYDEVSQLRGTTAQISNYKGYPAQFVQNTETGKMGVMQGDTAGNIKYLANEEQLTPLATKEELKPLAKDADVLKLIAQRLTPEQKAQIVKNLKGTFLPLTGGELTGPIYRPDNTSTMILRGGTNSYDSGASLYLSGRDTSEGAQFQLLAKDLDKGIRLIGNAKGKLLWGGDIVDCVDSSDLETASYVGGFSIRYRSGLQISVGYAETEITGNSYGQANVNYSLPLSSSKPMWGIGSVVRCSGYWPNVTAKIGASSTRFLFDISNPNPTQTVGVLGLVFGSWK